jgi:hypothetical protein
MVDAADERLKHALRYDAYAIYEADDGSFIAEPQRPEDDFQIVSRDIKELCRALDLIENLMVMQAVDAPEWLKRHLDAPNEAIVLPSAVPLPATASVVAQAAVSPPTAPSRSRFLTIHRDVKPSVIQDMIRQGRLWELLPSEIERRFLIPTEGR